MLFLIGFISLFLPYYESTVISCGFNSSSINYFYDNLLTRYLECFQNPNKIPFNLLEIVLQTIIILAVVFSTILIYYSKNKIAFSLVIMTLILLFIQLCFINEMLCYGFYVVLIHQLTLLALIINHHFKII